MKETENAKGTSLADLMRLFGEDVEDEDGRPVFIFPADEEMDEDDEVERFYEKQERSYFNPKSGQQPGFSGNDL